MTRTLTCKLAEGGAALPADLPIGDRSERLTPWLSRWEFDRGGKRRRVAVQRIEYAARERGAEWTTEAVASVAETFDAREFIETLGDPERWPAGTEFRIVVEEVVTP